jgi:hypothetical protein
MYLLLDFQFAFVAAWCIAIAGVMVFVLLVP